MALEFLDVLLVGRLADGRAALVLLLEELDQHNFVASCPHRLCWIEVLRDVRIQCRDGLASLLDAYIWVAPDFDTIRSALDASVEQKKFSGWSCQIDRESIGVRFVEGGQYFGGQRQSVEGSLV